MYRELRKPRPSIKLLYLTPEQLVNNAGLMDALLELRHRNLLARLVIDEVTRGKGDLAVSLCRHLFPWPRPWRLTDAP